MQKKQAYLIDAHGFLHRSYHALPKLSTSKGEEVGALYGFLRLLLKIMREKKPAAACVCFDSPAKTLREESYPEYKANRPPTEPALKAQLALARDLARAAGLPVLFADGYEADDLLAAAAAKLGAAGYHCVLVTTDKDAAQLVGPDVSLWDGSAGELKGPADVEKKFGVPPSLITDYFALVGDSSDNVPGAAGIGPKGALKLIASYGGLEGILAAAADPEKTAADKTLAKAAASADMARLSKKLVTLETGVPVEISAEALKVSPPDAALAAELGERLEFKDLLALAGPQSSVPAPAAETAGLEEALEAAGKELCAALEEDWVCAGGGGKFFLSEAGLLGAEEKRKLLSALLDPARHKTAFFFKDLLRLLGAPPDARLGNFTEAGLAYQLAASGSRASVLSRLVMEKAGVHAAEGPGGLPVCCAALPAAAKELLKELEAAGMGPLYSETELPLVEAVHSMEAFGIKVDRGALEKLSGLLEAEMAAAEADVRQAAGYDVNLNSPKQLSELIYGKFNIQLDKTQKRMFKTKSGGYSTGEEALTALSAAHPAIARILAHREAAKLKSSFVDNLRELADAEGRVHTSFDQAGAATGRFSSSRPNLQNIPVRTAQGREVRRAFAASEGHVLLSADYSQIDLRVLAHLSGDPALCAAFRAGEDIHSRTAAEVFGCMPELVTADQRRVAKAVNFGIVYGQTAQGLSRELGISRREAADYIERYFGVYSGVRTWTERVLEAARRDGYVATFAGRRRLIPDIKASNPNLRAFAERSAVNTPVQGGSAEIIKKAMLAVHARLRGEAARARMLLQVHDELIFEVKKVDSSWLAALVKKEMEGAWRLDVPLRADVKAGPDWLEMEKLG